MDSSSDGSFAWTDASNDTFGSEKINGNMSKVVSESESDSGKKYKKILQQELLIQNNDELQMEKKENKKKPHRKREQLASGADLPGSRGENQIKREPESDMDTCLKKPDQIKGHIVSDCYDSFDESHLRSRVAAERLASSPPPPHLDPDTRSEPHSSEASETLHPVQEDCQKSQKKKKKSKTRKLSVNPEDREPIESAKAKAPPPRMSERITFEEDDDDSPAEKHFRSHQPSIESSALKAFQSDSGLTPFARKLDEESVLTPDDDVWIVRCPRDVDIDAFHDRVVALEGKCKLKLNGQTYEGIVDEEAENVSLLSSERNRFVIKHFVIKGYVNLHRRVPKSHVRDEAIVNNTSFIALPETKCRHPLFGADYKRAIRAARRRPRAAPAASLPLSPTDPTHAKKKKRKRKLSNDECVAPVQIKRTKRDLESAEAWESEQAIEENLFNF